MKIMLMAVLLCAAPAFAGDKADSAPVEDNCGSVNERKAGTMLADGTVAGEKEALDYFKAKEPELYAAVQKLERAALRKRFAGQLMWFQRVGRCRQRQKAESVRQLKAELAADGLAAGYKTAAAADRPAIEKKLRAELEARFDSEMAGMDQEADNLEAAVREFQEEAAGIREKIVVRKKSRDAIIDKRLKELTGS